MIMPKDISTELLKTKLQPSNTTTKLTTLKDKTMNKADNLPMSAEEKDNEIKGILTQVSKVLVATMEAYDLKTHIECKIDGDVSCKSYVLTFREKNYHDKVLNDLLSHHINVLAERKYSEEDMKEAFIQGASTDLFNTWDLSKEEMAKEKFQEWLKKFKK